MQRAIVELWDITQITNYRPTRDETMGPTIFDLDLVRNYDNLLIHVPPIEQIISTVKQDNKKWLKGSEYINS